MKKQIAAKISPSKIAKHHTEKAVREGRLREYCFKTYGEEYVKKNFCPGCSHAGICRKGENHGGN